MMILWPLTIFVCKLWGWPREMQNRASLRSGDSSVCDLVGSHYRANQMTQQTLLLLVYFTSSEMFSILVGFRFLLLIWCLCCSSRRIFSLGPSVYLTKMHFFQSHRESTVKDCGVEKHGQKQLSGNQHFWLKYQCSCLLWRGPKCNKWLSLVWC